LALEADSALHSLIEAFQGKLDSDPDDPESGTKPGSSKQAYALNCRSRVGDVKQFAKATQRRTLFLDLRQRPKLVPHNACRREGSAGCFPELLTAPL
jgi:hypothetical protein